MLANFNPSSEVLNQSDSQVIKAHLQHSVIYMYSSMPIDLGLCSFYEFSDNDRKIQK